MKQLLNSKQMQMVSVWLYRKCNVGVCFDELYSKISCGIDALFIPIDEKHGIKLFHANAGEYSYHYQRIFAAMGLAPKAWGFGKVTLYGRELTYFYTERVEVLCEIEEKYYSSPEYQDAPYIAFYKSKQLIKEARKQMEEVSMFVDEDGCGHSGNYGMLNGKCVIIDFGNLGYKKDMSARYGEQVRYI